MNITKMEVIMPSIQYDKPESGGSCWRCGGEGVVGSGEDVTLCGACLGTKQGPAPCPKCKSTKVKIAFDGAVFWRCRDCGHQGPGSQEDLYALVEWDKACGVIRPRYVECCKTILETLKDRPGEHMERTREGFTRFINTGSFYAPRKTI